MATTNVSLPDQMKHRADVPELCELQRLVSDGLESGISSLSKNDILEAARQQASAMRDA